MIRFAAFAGPVRGMRWLAIFDGAGFKDFDPSFAGVRQSWWTLLLALPFTLVSLSGLNLLQQRLGRAPESLPFNIIEDLAGWLIYLGLFTALSQWLDRRRLALPAIMVLNWARLWGAMLAAPLYLLVGFDIIDRESFALLLLTLLVYTFALNVFIIRSTLDIPFTQALPIALFEIILDVGVSLLFD